MPAREKKKFHGESGKQTNVCGSRGLRLNHLANKAEGREGSERSRDLPVWLVEG